MLLRKVDDTIGFIHFLLTPIVLGPFIACWISPHIYDDTVHGFVEPGYEEVLEAFRRNFGEGLEREGAAVAVYHRGRPVVDLWGGYADKEANVLWKRNTRTVLFSSTKAISALCVAVLVDRGLLRYEDRLTDFWPEYGSFGKENTTVEDVLTHKAGLPYLDDDIDIDDVTDFARIERKIENAKPIWQPGSASGYHAVTFGFIVDGIIRRVDEKHRDLKTFLREEITHPYDLSVDIGVDRREAHRVARVTTPSLWEFLRDCIKNPKLIGMLGIMYARFDEIVWRMRENTKWLLINYDTMAVNDPDILSLSMPAVTGVANAADLSRLFSLALDGTLIRNSTLERISTPTLDDWHLERVALWPIRKGHGFFYERNPIAPGKFVFGHPGYGCQFVLADPSNQLTIAYVANGLKTGTAEVCTTYMRLQRAVYDALRDS
ncbi:hypothetical protein Y032_0313g2202 [Ancylostoma ceylanicum]|uniref:Beta-lactamase-related domain-containing protein n=2 Tax=Ancylostoma ceylanicum TaxID=53326 RepID=A0A016S1Z5_9BILA|nr:hypothetical protein Y032_0313g2202 [Ancylostoma ceylanicum]